LKDLSKFLTRCRIHYIRNKAQNTPYLDNEGGRVSRNGACAYLCDCLKIINEVAILLSIITVTAVNFTRSKLYMIYVLNDLV